MKKDNLLFKNESTFIALGFGSGLAKFAPGTFGTLIAIPLFYFSQLLPQYYDYFFVITLFFIGIYVSNKTCLIMKMKDPSCIVIDEIVIYLAPSLLGSGKSFMGDLGISTINDVKHLQMISSHNFDGDIKVQYAVGGGK